MTFRLKPHESVSAGLERILHDELEKALNVLPPQNEGEAVHGIRTHCKKIRALLRLMRKTIGDDAYRYENRFFRDVASPLRELRDAKVLITTFDTLADNDFSDIRDIIEDDYRLLRQSKIREERVFNTVIEKIEEAECHIHPWHLNHMGRTKLRRGLGNTYRKARDAFILTKKQTTTAHLHEWRKQSKYLWYQLKVARPLGPKRIKGLVCQCRRLTKYLGTDHDLAVLHKMLYDNPYRATLLLGLIVDKRTKLQKKALRIGKQLYRQRPNVFVGKLV